jgi:hypothetical protein
VWEVLFANSAATVDELSLFTLCTRYAPSCLSSSAARCLPLGLLQSRPVQCRVTVSARSGTLTASVNQPRRSLASTSTSCWSRRSSHVAVLHLYARRSDTYGAGGPRLLPPTR